MIQTLIVDGPLRRGQLIAIWSNHAYQAGWQAGDPDTLQTVDWVRVWTKGGQHFTPLTAGLTYSVPFAGTGSFVLPTATAVWGSDVAETIRALPTDVNEPGGSAFGQWGALPPGITYDAGLRTLAVDNTVSRPGRVHIIRNVDSAGSSCEPQRILLEVGPVINLSNQSVVAGTNFTVDVYAACDVGQILPKTISVTGLPSGASYSASTGLITGNVAAGNYTGIAISVTNSSGQVATKSLTLTSAATPTGPAIYEAWTGPGWFRASDGLVLDGANVTSVTNRRSGGGNLTKGGSGGSITAVAGAQAGKQILRLVRNVTTASVMPHLTATSADPISAMFGGSNAPFTVLLAWKPTDENSGIAWSATKNASGNSQVTQHVRRSGTASSLRRNLAAAATGDRPISDAAGEPGGIARVVCVRFDGTTVTAWSNSTTKVSEVAAQAIGAFDADQTFRMFVGGNAGTFQLIQSNLDWYETVVDNVAHTDAQCQQAVTDMAAQWGIALS